MQHYSSLLEPDLFAAGVIYFFAFLAVRQAALRLSLSLAVGFTAVQAAHQLIVMRFDSPPHHVLSLTALVWLLAPLSLSQLSRKSVETMGACIFWLAMAFTLFFRVFGAPAPVSAFFGAASVGLIYQPSMNPALLAVTLPFVSRPGVWTPYKAIAEALTLWCVLDSHHLTPLLAYLAVQATWVFTCERGLCFAFVVLGTMGCFIFPPTFHGQNRLGEYTFFFDQFRQHWSFLWGMGVNKFFIYGPLLQSSMQGMSGSFWTFLHSDWGELLLQQGMVGAALWLWVYADVIREAYRTNRVLLQAAVGMGAFMIGYFPLHVTSSALVACLCLTVLKTSSSSG